LRAVASKARRALSGGRDLVICSDFLLIIRSANCDYHYRIVKHYYRNNSMLFVLEDVNIQPCAHSVFYSNDTEKMHNCNATSIPAFGLGMEGQQTG